MTKWSTWRAAHPDTLVLSTDTGFDFDAQSVAYTHELLAAHDTYRHELADQQVAVTLHDDGSVTMDVAGEQYQPLRVYWFAWFTFHPETELIR